MSIEVEPGVIEPVFERIPAIGYVSTANAVQRYPNRRLERDLLR